MKPTLVIFFFALSVAVCAEDMRCSPSEAQRAETEAGTFRSWDSLYKSYRSYRHCDDAAIGEGYSESVARILKDHWETLPQFAQLSKKDPGFRWFALKHVDETLDLNDIKKISTNAKTRCLNQLRVLCDDLRKRADVLIEP